MRSAWLWTYVISYLLSVFASVSNPEVAPIVFLSFGGVMSFSVGFAVRERLSSSMWYLLLFLVGNALACLAYIPVSVRSLLEYSARVNVGRLPVHELNEALLRGSTLTLLGFTLSVFQLALLFKGQADKGARLV